MPQFPNEAPELPTKEPGRMKSWPYPLAVIVFILGLAMSLLFWEKGKDSKRSAQLAPQEQAQQPAEGPKVEEPSSATATAYVQPSEQKPKDRSGLARIVSPDGVWRLSVESVGSPDVSVENTLVIRQVSGTGKKVLATTVDDLDPQKTNITVHSWEAAGWSSDNTTVYYAARLLGLGMGVGGFAPAVFGAELHAVTVKGAKDTRLAVYTTGADPSRNGLVAVSPTAKRAAFLEDGSLFTAAFDGSEKRAVYEVKDGKEIWQAMYDPSGAKLAVLLREPKTEGDDVWTVGILDGKGGIESLGASINGGLVDWTKSAGLAYLSMHADGSFTEEHAFGAK